MGSLGGPAAQVRAACRKAEQARKALEQAEDLTGEAHDTLARALEGARNLEADTAVMLAHFIRVVDGCKGHLWPLLNEAVRTAEGFAARLESRGATPSATPPPHHPARPSEPVPSTARGLQSGADGHAIARDGSRYPAQAQWAVDDLPRRVRRGAEGEKTVGRVRVDEADRGVMTSGRDGTWTPAVHARMARLGITTPLRLGNHVEMKVAHLLVDTMAVRAEVVINHQPCGSPGFRLGTSACHQVLPRYLPRGKTLTVHGTTADGEPFTHTYQGRT